MLRRLEVCFRIDTVDRRIMSHRAAEVPMAGRRNTASTEDNRCHQNEKNHAPRANANANEQIVTWSKHDGIALSWSNLEERQQMNNSLFSVFLRSYLGRVDKSSNPLNVQGNRVCVCVR